MADRLNAFLTGVVDFAWVLELTITALAWVVVCHGMKGEKGTAKGKGIQFGVLLLVMAGMNILLMVLIPNYVPVIWSLGMGVVSAGYVHVCSPYRRQTNVILWCSQFAGMVALTVIAGQMSFLTGLFWSKGAMEGVARCMVHSLSVPLALYLRQFNFEEFDTMPPSGIALIIVGDIGLLVLHVMESMWMNGDYRLILMVLGAFCCILAMVIFAIYAMYTMCREQTEIISLQAERQRLLAEQEHMKLMQASLEDLRCVRHDLKNQYAYMQILLEERRYTELADYFRQVSENLPQGLNYVDCGNASMNTILNMEINKAKQRNIVVETHLVVPPVLPFPADDLCAIVANLMDNAIDECGRVALQGQTHGTVRLDIYPQKSYLFIMCRNRTDRQELKRHSRGLRTTKEDEQLHGYGTRIVTKTAEKYNGCAEFTLESGEFVAKVLLDMMEGKPDADQNCAV